MYRHALRDLEKWKNSTRRKPLMLTGVRQCGKTFLIREFGASSFKNTVYINFEENPGYSGIFEYDLQTDRILRELESFTRETIIPGETLLFFDEIQECPRAITALKYFCENKPDLHLVCAGSLLGVALRQKNISFPVGKIQRMRLRPLDFREFVLACGEGVLLETFENWPTDRVIPDLYSVRMSRLLTNYYIVGGMPEAVNAWIETDDYTEAEIIQKSILEDYADDFSKHAPITELPKIRWIWDSVPVQLARENNKFVFSHVREGKRSAELENALQWLKDAGLITTLELAAHPSLPLSHEADKTYFKVYLSDVGLLRVRSGISPDTILGGTELFARYKGAFTENYVLNELLALGKEPYFWRSGNTAELDFLYENHDRIIPVEVKSADNTQAKSYRLFCKKYSPAAGCKLSTKNIAENDCEGTRTISLPLYLAWAIDHYID